MEQQRSPYPVWVKAFLLFPVSMVLLAGDVTVVRDDWGIAHVFGKTDADAVFGAIYAQAEDDFNRIETNYLMAMGRLAEAEGESKIYQDLRMKLFINPDRLKEQYHDSPPWLQKLMIAFADGLNYYLEKHPEVKPRVIRRFEPWMALSFTEGSIGGDIEQISVADLEAFYGGTRRSVREWHDPDAGSNGFAIAPSNTAARKALLLINPHTSFFFRSELQMVSDEGLNAYGAATWGQFFIYQGFNEHCGWMHTSSGVDVIDEYLETIVHRDGRPYYKYGSEERPVTVEKIRVPYRKSDGGLEEKTFTLYRTHHGPVIRESDGKWVTVQLMQEPVKALMQSYLRTKAKGYKEFRETMELKANSSNNTVFADDRGNIAYFQGNFIPKRDTSFDWTQPVDGSNPATDWKGLHALDEIPHLLNPKSGWVYNSNDAPWSAGGAGSLKRDAFPRYVDSYGVTARGRHAIRVLSANPRFTLDSLIAAAYDSYLPWFEKPLPALIKAWDAATPADGRKARLSGPIAVLRKWDMRWSGSSVATAIAVFWAEEVTRRFADDARRAGINTEEYTGTKANPGVLLDSLSAATDRLTRDFGRWDMPWGEINRFQRLTGALDQAFSDSAPSTPVPFTWGNWGSLASFAAKQYPGTKRWYGTSGNSFVAVVEFGDGVRARAITAGGESGHPESRHFNDEVKRYAEGNLREVYFYRAQLKGHTEREYRIETKQ